jgi:pimeloyl-ACP methyl ester carboxylesterase
LEPLFTTFPVFDEEIGRAEIATWIYPPQPQAHSESRPAIWAFFLPGGSYSGLGYYDLQVPGERPESYSMARTLSEQGIGFITIDNIGTGQSPCRANGFLLTRERCAALYAQYTSQLRARLVEGSLLPGLAPLTEERVFLVGGGHSMGAYLLAALQALFRPFDAIALLGWSPGPVIKPSFAEQWKRLMERGLSEQNGYLTGDRTVLRPFLYGDPAVVPDEVIHIDEANAVCSPAGLILVPATSEAAQNEEALLAQIRCPLYLGFGEADMPMDPSVEPQYYPNCTDLTRFLLAGAAHCANFAPGRRYLWEHLASWMHAHTHLSRLPFAAVTSSSLAE